MAAGFGHAAVVRRLIQADAKVDQVDRYGRTQRRLFVICVYDVYDVCACA